jgi:hypothetical protein
MRSYRARREQKNFLFTTRKPQKTAPLTVLRSDLERHNDLATSAARPTVVLGDQTGSRRKVVDGSGENFLLVGQQHDVALVELAVLELLLLLVVGDELARVVDRFEDFGCGIGEQTELVEPEVVGAVVDFVLVAEDDAVVGMGCEENRRDEREQECRCGD